MAKEKVSEWSSTPGSNTEISGINISEGCAPSGINDAIREVMAQIKDWQAGVSGDPSVLSQGVMENLASAATTDIGAQNTNFLRITGNTTITSFGSNYRGPRFLVFAGAVTLTNSATLVLPGNANITTAAEDVLIAIPGATLGTADKWIVAAYQAATGYLKSNNPSYTGTLTGGTGVVNLGSGQFYKDASGNVGIGTSSPTAKLEVHSTASTGRVLLNGADLPMITNGYDKFTSGAYNGAGRYGLFMEFNTIAAGFPNDSNKGFKVLRLNPDSSSSTAFQVGFNNGGKHYAATNGYWNNMTLLLQDDSAGVAQPGIGFHAPANGSAAIIKMYGSSSNFECRNASDSGFVAILASAFPVSSDYRIKTNVVEFGSVLSNVLALRPVNYEKDGITGREYGLIAHEAAELFPDLVQGEKDGMRSDGTMELQTVSYTGLTSVLVKAIQEQQAIIAALTARVAALEAA